jgi:hypothetical protein
MSIPSQTAPGIADVMLVLLEQKNLGVSRGNLQPQNLRLRARAGVYFLADYDQAEMLADGIVAKDNLTYLTWCNDKAQSRYGFEDLLCYLPDGSCPVDI